MKPIKYENLRAGDLVFTGGKSLFARVIRRITGKGGSPRTVATHVGIIVDFHGQKLIAEMLSQGLSISSLEEYRKNDRRFIISVKRVMLSPEREEKLNRQIALDRRRTIEYDWKGILSFMLHNPNNPEKYYCSEYVWEILLKVGINLPKNNDGTISPEGLRTHVTIFKDVEFE